MKPASLLLIALYAATASYSNAELTAHDGFNYTSAGDLTGQNGGTGWLGSYTDIGNSTIVDTVGLTYGGFLATGGSARTADGGSATTISFRNFDRVYGDDETETWISFLGRRNGGNSTTFAGVSFYNNGGAAAINGEFSISNGTSANTWQIFDVGANNYSNSTVAIGNGVTHLLVARIQWGAGTGGADIISFFVNPDLTTTPSTPNVTRQASMTNFDKIRIAGANATNFNFDELRVGDSFTDVAPIRTNPFVTWIDSFFPGETSPAIIGKDAHPDGDGTNNLAEFALNGDPKSEANHGFRAVATEDTSADTQKELTLVIAVRKAGGSPVFAGSPLSATSDGVKYTIEGSLVLDFPASSVSEAPPATGPAGLSADYEYRRFRLDASEGLAGKGFFRVKIEAAF